MSGLFNTTIKQAAPDWSTAPSNEESSFSLIPSPTSDLAEFIFSPTLPVFSEKELSYDPASDDLIGQSDDLINVQDFCEIFTNIDDLLALDPIHENQHNFIINTEDIIENVRENIQLLPAEISSNESSFELHNTHERPVDQCAEIAVLEEIIPPSNSTPDHSYSMVGMTATKRKFSETVPTVTSSSVLGDISALTENRCDIIKRTKYLERRRKNNIASRRSREIRKNKFEEMDREAEILEMANEALRQKIELLESLTIRMKDALISKLSGNQQ
jgi:hypothetical protein